MPRREEQEERQKSFDEILESRRSIREYTTKPVSFEDIMTVCETARLAPMAGNIYTVRIIIISDLEKKREVAKAALDQEFLAKASYILVICSDTTRTKLSYGDRAETYAKQQAGAAIENMLLKVSELGLAGCWVGAFEENMIKRTLNIPAQIQVEAIVPIANPFGKTPEKRKPGIAMITFFEKWGQKTRKPIKKVPG